VAYQGTLDARCSTLNEVQVSQDVESVASIRARAEQRLDRHQRMMEVLTTALGRPRTVYVTMSIVVGWVAFNLVTPKLFG
jgi:uncharacterized membrane protein